MAGLVQPTDLRIGSPPCFTDICLLGCFTFGSGHPAAQTPVPFRATCCRSRKGCQQRQHFAAPDIGSSLIGMPVTQSGQRNRAYPFAVCDAGSTSSWFMAWSSPVEPATSHS